MNLPTFFCEAFTPQNTHFFLDENASHHALHVLRLPVGAAIQITNGNGWMATATIKVASKKNTEVAINTCEQMPRPSTQVSIAISLVKNTARFEWFLEKATEIGVTQIFPLLCQRTERAIWKQERMNQIVVSAMLQSQQAWMPQLHAPMAYKQAIQHFAAQLYHKWIGHCLQTQKQQLTQLLARLNPTTAHSFTLQNPGHYIFFIGPEGDFTQPEIDLALANNFAPAALGNTRLRTETAGIVAATILVNAG